MLAHDLRFALRRLRFRPGFALLVTLTLALGIGAATTVFTVVDSVLLRPLPFADADRLVELNSRMRSGFRTPYIAPEAVDEWERQVTVLRDVARYNSMSVVLETGEPIELAGAEVSQGLFSLLGIPPRLGRTFAPEEVESGARVVIVSDEFWRSQLGADQDVMGREIALSGERYTVVGVMPASFRFPRTGVSVWLPMSPAAIAGGAPAPRSVHAIGRLAPGVDLAAAQGVVDRIGEAMARDRPDMIGAEMELVPVGAWRANKDMRLSLLVLTGAVGCVLLIACGNAANLLLVRASNDARGLAVRVALGATRARVVRELLVETSLLAAMAGGLGVIMAMGGVHVVRALAPSELTALGYTTITMDARVLAAAVMMAVATVLLAGLIPALQATRQRRSNGWGDRTGTGTSQQRRFRSVLVVGQLALSMVMLVGAGLLVHSFVRLLNVPPGMEVERLALLYLTPSSSRYPDRAARAAFYEDVLDRMRAVPGVRAASVVGGVAGRAGFHFSLQLEAEDAGAPLAHQPELLPVGKADSSYFSTLGIPIIDGRSFTADDMVPGTNVVIVDAELARALWPDGRAVGRRFRTDGDGEWLTVVGVSAPVRLMGPDDRDSPYSFYVPTPLGAPGYQTIAVRTSGDPGPLLPMLKEVVYSVDPLQPMARTSTALEVYREPLARPRFLLVVMAFFAGVAALLAAVGLYGVISFTVAQRTRELGVRVALGAQTRQIVAGVLVDGGRLALVGIALGVVAALAASRVLSSLLFGVSPTDPLTLVVVAAGLGGITLLACWIPAARAGRVDPVVALRSE